MSGYFYAFEDCATCGQELPDVWDGDVLVKGAMLRSQRGVWLSVPVLSEPDESDVQTVEVAGVKSEPFVILSPVEYPGAAAFRITPDGEQGFM